MDYGETNHFVNQYFSEYKGTNVIPANAFNKWFAKIDEDGDGKIDMTKVAHHIKELRNKIKISSQND